VFFNGAKAAFWQLNNSYAFLKSSMIIFKRSMSNGIVVTGKKYTDFSYSSRFDFEKNKQKTNNLF
jgi:hypothetical protein